MQTGISLKEIVEKHVYERQGFKHIKLKNYRLDFSSEFAYLGMTSTNKVKLGDIQGHNQETGEPIIFKKYFGITEIDLDHTLGKITDKMFIELIKKVLRK